MYLEYSLQGMIFKNSIAIVTDRSFTADSGGKSDDELVQPDNKLRIGTRSGKFRKVELPMNA